MNAIAVVSMPGEYAGTRRDETADVRQRVLLRMLGHPLVLAPGILGATALAACWAAGFKVDMGLFAGLAGLLASAGVFVTRLVLDGGETARTIFAEIAGKKQAAQQARLDDLDQRLVAADGDPRPEEALRDMRSLVKAFEELEAEVDSTRLSMVLEINEKVRDLHERTIFSLEQTLKLGAMAQRLQIKAARQPIIAQRERLVTEILAGVKQLGDAYAALQRLGTGEAMDAGLSSLRADLDASLSMAGRVEDRLRDLLEEPTAPIEPPSAKSPQKREEPT